MIRNRAGAPRRAWSRGRRLSGRLGAGIVGGAVILAAGTGLMLHVRRRMLREVRQAREVAGAARSVLLRPLPARIDGLATGATLRAAARAVRGRGPARLIIAVPVGAREAVAALAEEADRVVCPAQPEPFIAIGLHYEDFGQVDDEEVLALLQRMRG